jgi:oligopeptide transport system permease protein
MWKYVLKRIGLALVTAFIILSLTFILIQLLPFPQPQDLTKDGSFAYYEKQTQLGYVVRFEEEQSDLGEKLWSYETQVNNKEVTYYFYEVPTLTQYGRWLKNIITKWDWGVSVKIEPNRSAILIIGSKLPTSMKLNIISSLIAVPIGILLGIVAALKKNKPTDNIISTGVMILISVPSFVLITFLILILCYKTGWLPTEWPKPTAGIQEKILGYIIPVTALSLGSIAGYCRFTRAELCEVMSSEYLLLARTKGLTKRQAILRHALRNAMVPIVPSIIAEFLSIMGGSMILENLYGIPGIGRLFVQALNGKDYNVLFVDMAIFTTFGLLAGVLLDISYGFIDPRIRMGAKK